MECCICRSMPPLHKPPRNTICDACYEGAKGAISLMNNKLGVPSTDDKYGVSSSPTSFKPQPLANLPTFMSNMKEAEKELKEKVNFLGGFAALFKDRILTDIQLKPGNGGPCLSAHRCLLAARSEIFKNMLDSDSCKSSAPENDTVTLPELNHDELESLLEFLYSGDLPLEKLDKHIYSLTIAADKYEIPYLIRFCERHMLKSLDSSNVLDVLEVSDSSSNQLLREAALGFIAMNMEGLVFSSGFERFVHKNPHLVVQITRAFFVDAKNRNNII